MTGTNRRLLSVLYPGTCVCCGAPADPDLLVCTRCGERFFRITPPVCRYCGVSLDDCRCSKKPHAYEAVAAPYYYEAACRDAILGMKYGNREDAAIPLARAMNQTLHAQYFGIPFDIITCVPMTREGKAKRGYNQAASLARRIRTETIRQPDFDPNLLKKQSTERAQHKLGAEGRKKNIFGAIRLNRGRDVTGKTILLIDDIVTTGATANECATILRLEGAKAVYVLTAAITRYNKKSFTK